MIHVLVAAMEITLGPGVARSTIDATYAHRYVPRLESDPTSGGSAGHSLDLDGAGGVAVQGRLGLDLGARVGLELLACHSRPGLRGTSTPLDIQMHYTSRQPPSYESRVFEVDSTQPWPDPQGRVRQFVVALNLRLHTPVGRPVTFAVSAGPALHHVSGSLESLAYSSHRLGGHSTVIGEIYELGVDLPSRRTVGFDVGGEAVVRLGARTALVADARYFHARRAELEASVRRIASANRVIQPFSVADARTRVPLRPLTVRTSFATMCLALRLRL